MYVKEYGSVFRRQLRTELCSYMRVFFFPGHPDYQSRLKGSSQATGPADGLLKTSRWPSDELLTILFKGLGVVLGPGKEK